MTRNLLFPILLTYGLLEAVTHIIRFDPDFVIGTGGYLAFPAVLAARLTSRPAFIQEQNSHAGIASRKSARFADLIFIAYEETAGQLRWLEKCILSGNPVRPDLGTVEHDEACARFGLDPARQTILIFGGSQGATSINEKISASLDDFAAIENSQLIWQVGNDKDKIDTFSNSGVAGVALDFIDDMAAAYAAASLVLCRAGALTLSELTATAKPAILIPYPHATDDHQTKNAKTLVDAGAAILVPDSELAEFPLVKTVDELLADEMRLLQMGMAAGSLGHRNAAEQIIQRIFEFMDWR
jgi:UDP-N-acetylglucosamine--N-acetylmuramyl-(pentapeptide) pyrophosphoryl-undecaprenol N-acetylglucosamine transferase